MFNQTETVNTRMAVIEEKFTVYEKMMDKLESAIQTISEINQNISRMLSVHEEKIDTNNKTDDIIFDKIKRLEQKNSDEHQKVIDKLEKFEASITESINQEKLQRDKELDSISEKVNGIAKFRWLFAGGLAVAVFIVSNSHVMVDILTPEQTPATIEKVK